MFKTKMHIHFNINLFRILFSAALIILGFSSISQSLQSFPLSQVQLLDSDFKKAQDADMRYIIELDMDRLLAPYLKSSGLEPKADNYTNWENTGLDGHIGGHYLSALAMMYASTGDAQIKDRMDYYLSELKRAQDADGDGYLGGIPDGKSMWEDVKNGKIDVGRFGLNGKWVPLYNIHKIYAGLRDAYWFGGSELAKEMLIALTDWMLETTKKLSDVQVQKMLYSEHGGLNETFADVYEITGEEKYLTLARKFSDLEILNPLLESRDDLTGKHANTQIPKVIGYQRIGVLADDEQWNNASKYFWDNVVNKRSVSIGGNSVREHFHSIDDFSTMINGEEGPETCNTYNMLRLTKGLFLDKPSADFMDYYERGLYNHILSSVEPERAGFVYFTPMRPGHYRVYSQPQTSMWCCVGSGLENHTKYGEMIYAKNDDGLYVNLFIPSVLNWSEKGIMVKQETTFPEKETTQFTITTAKKQSFKLGIRKPNWLAGSMGVTVNGKAVEAAENDFGYLVIDRKWKNGDVVEVSLPMEVSVEQIADGSHYYSFLYGPIVLAAKTTDKDLEGLYADDSRGGHVASGPKYSLNDMPIIVSEKDELADKITPISSKPLTFSISNLTDSPYPNLELIPFYKLHNSRYIIYWRSETSDGLQVIAEKIAAEEAAREALEHATVDLIYPGEQQPESDHFIKSEDSETGIHNKKHWRHARGWFSYEMKNPQSEATKLRVMYWGQDNGRDFTIYVNEVSIAEVSLNGSHGLQFFTEDYSIPEELKQAAKLVVKFTANENSTAGGVYEVRLMK